MTPTADIVAVEALRILAYLIRHDELVSFIGLALQASGLIIACVALHLARQQLIPLRRDIASLASADKRQERLREELIPPGRDVEVLGFDARFTNGDWNRILSDLSPEPSTIKFKLHHTYNAFYESIRKQPPPLNTPSILVIGLVYVSEFLDRGWIDPIPEALMGIDRLAKLRAEARGLRFDKPVIELAKYLCSDSGGQVGALPLWINSHGKMMPDPQLFEDKGRITTISTLDGLFARPDADDVLSEAGIQSYHLMLEFWAHLAYRGCRMFRADEKVGRAIRSDLLSSSADLLTFAQATADLATRLRFSNRTRDVFGTAKKRAHLKDEPQFNIGHNADALAIRESLALWKPVFSSELLWRASRHDQDPAARLTDQTDFRTPFYRHASPDDWSYLSAISGYGLAFPKGAAKDQACVDAMKFLFLANPAVMHPYIAEMLDYESSADQVRDFAERHARPRWPFWPQVNNQISYTLFALLLSLDRTTVMTPQEFRTDCVDKVLSQRPRIRRLLVKIQKIAAAHSPSWKFTF